LFSDRRPGFLFIHLFDTHHPYIPPSETYGKFGPPTPKLMDPQMIFSEFLDWAKVDPHYTSRATINRYDELILYVDQMLGRFFLRMQELGRYDNALIIVLSDHGEEFFDHGYWGHSNFLYEEMVRVPLIVKWPKGACAGSRLVDAPIPARAIGKLILDMAGDPARRDELLRCEVDGVPKILHDLVETGPILSETQSMGPNRFSARTTTEKLIEPFMPGNPLDIRAMARPWEYFRLKEDPREIFNLYEPGGAPALEQAIETARRDRESATGDLENIQLDRRTMERLKSLGYLN
ncbi:MAG: sulfatase-like hydrolase/transferase, partial [Deltaproteobacteria bacterium]|nr:sulfatase-like hydrolase/transferase [Deltaproteobacteria bacterium]